MGSLVCSGKEDCVMYISIHQSQFGRLCGVNIDRYMIYCDTSSSSNDLAFSTLDRLDSLEVVETLLTFGPVDHNPKIS